jgi:hypothetical protein
MDKYLIITKHRNGRFTIKDTVTYIPITYYVASERMAIAKHRKDMGIQRLHFIKIYL